MRKGRRLAAAVAGIVSDHTDVIVQNSKQSRSLSDESLKLENNHDPDSALIQSYSSAGCGCAGRWEKVSYNASGIDGFIATKQRAVVVRMSSVQGKETISSESDADPT